MITIRVLLLYLFILFATCNNTRSNSNDKGKFLSDTTIVYKSIPNVDKNLTSLDIYTPPNNNKLLPVVIWIHGGAWAIGDKTNKMDLKVPYFKGLNYILVSVNYRLSPYPAELKNDKRIKHPDHIIDVADALQWVEEHINLYGGDSSKIAILRHSAGAHLAALLGANQSLLTNRSINPEHIKGIGVIDTQAFNLVDVMGKNFYNNLYRNAFGNQKQNYIDASPYYQLDNSKRIPLFWLFVERGSQKRKHFLNDFILKLEKRNTKITKINANAYSHMEVSDLIGNNFNTLMTDAVTNFLEDCFKN